MKARIAYMSHDPAIVEIQDGETVANLIERLDMSIPVRGSVYINGELLEDWKNHVLIDDGSKIYIMGPLIGIGPNGCTGGHA